MNLRLAIDTLTQHRVRFVVVGGVAVVAHGAALMTRDLDILYSLEPDNVGRLVEAFRVLGAVAHGDPRRLPFRLDHLSTTGHHLADTRAGRIDALGAIGKNADIFYETVVEASVEMEAFGTRFLCSSIEDLIAIKEELGRPRDLLAVQELRAILKLRSKR